MKLQLPTAEIFVPDGRSTGEALARITHLGIGAHADDLEFMAFHGIRECFRSETQWFGGVTCTDGAGSARSGTFADCTDEAMAATRREEQRRAATIGRYAAMVQLDYPSEVAKDSADTRLRADIRAILAATHPRVLYTHNLADKHDTHIAVTVAVIQAVRAMPRELRPAAVHGCEMWRGLDWLGDDEKIVHDVGGDDALAEALNGVFASQIAGGKRYDLAVMGRRCANATFYKSHGIDRSAALAFAMDLTPLAHDESLDIGGFVTDAIERFKSDVAAKLKRQLGR